MLGRLLNSCSCSMVDTKKEGTAPGMAQDGLTIHAWDSVIMPRGIDSGHPAVHSGAVMWAILDHFQEAFKRHFKRRRRQKKQAFQEA